MNINFGSLEARSLQTSDITGIATGYRDLDHMTTGLHEEELIILAARPAVGKQPLLSILLKISGQSWIRQWLFSH